MNISPFKSDFHQASLFDEPLGGHGHIRTVIGDITERLTAKFVGGRLHKDIAGFYCPDVSTLIKSRRVFIECKAAGRSRQTFIYAGRLTKDLEFSGQADLLYAILHHKTQTKQAQTVGQLQTLFLASLAAFYLVPFGAIYSHAKAAGKTKINGSYGKRSGEKIYGAGYRISLKKLDAYRIFSW